MADALRMERFQAQPKWEIPAERLTSDLFTIAQAIQQTDRNALEMPAMSLCRCIVKVIILSLAVTPADAGSRVEVVGDKCVLVDGRPFFPVGIYSARVDDFPKLADAGFNLVHTYGWEGISGHDWGREWLDAANERGLKTLIGLYRPRVKRMQFDACIKRIEQYCDHPSLLAWHTMDEPGWKKEDDRGGEYMPAAYQLVKQHDTHHPVTAVVCHFADTRWFVDTVDIMQADYYPVPPIPAVNYSGNGFRGIKIFVDSWREASKANKPFWFVCQAFDYSLLKDKSHNVPAEWKRFPTHRELRTMTYTAIASGARGVLYWSLSRLKNSREGSDVTGEDHWERLKSITLELKQLMPLLTADTPETIQTKDRVVAMVKSDGRDTYIIAANCERRPTEVELDVPGIANATAEVLFGKGSAKVEAAKLPISLEAIESRVYRISGKN